MASYLVVSTSGNPDSNSRRMGRIAFKHLEKAKVSSAWLDISELNLPLCDADACYTRPGAKKVSKAIEEADGILIATPVYNYDVSAAAKNLVELTGSAWDSPDQCLKQIWPCSGESIWISIRGWQAQMRLSAGDLAGRQPRSRTRTARY